MGLLDLEKLQSDPLFQVGLGILANNKGHYGKAGPAIAGGVMQGMAEYERRKKEQEQKDLWARIMQAGQIKANPGMYKVGDKAFGTQDEANKFAEDEFKKRKLAFMQANAPQQEEPMVQTYGMGMNTADYNGIGLNGEMTEPFGTMQFLGNEAFPQREIPQMPGIAVTDEQIGGRLPVSQVPGTPGGFDPYAAARAALQSQNPQVAMQALGTLANYRGLMPEEAKQYKPELITDWSTGKPVQRWVVPGQQGGVEVGMGKPDEASKPVVRPRAMPNGMFQDWAFDPVTYNPIKPIGELYPRGPNASSTNINVNNKLQTEEQKEKGKLNIGMLGEARNASVVARKLNSSAAIMQKYAGVSGWGANAKKVAASVLGSLGVKDAEQYATDAQVFNSQAKEVVLQKQLAQKGPQTESDARRIEETGANLANTPAANKFILDVAMAQNDRDIAYYEHMQKWWAKNGTLEGADEAWYEGQGSASLFDSQRLKKYGVSQGNGGWSIRRK